MVHSWKKLLKIGLTFGSSSSLWYVGLGRLDEVFNPWRWIIEGLVEGIAGGIYEQDHLGFPKTRSAQSWTKPIKLIQPNQTDQNWKKDIQIDFSSLTTNWFGLVVSFENVWFDYYRIEPNKLYVTQAIPLAINLFKKT